MCTRFDAAHDMGEVRAAFGIARRSGDRDAGAATATPGSRLTAIVRNAHGDAVLTEATFGFSGVGPRPLANARIETVGIKPTFAGPVARSRCAVPVGRFYEAGRAFSSEEGTPLALAAIARHEDDGAGGLRLAVALLTRPADAVVAAVHDRMPVPLAGDALDAWLDAATGADEAIAAATACTGDEVALRAA